MTSRRFPLATWVSSLCLLATGCHSAPAPLDATPLPLQVGYRPLLANGVAPAPTAATTAAAAVELTLHRLRTEPPGVSTDVVASAIRSERGAPFRGASNLPADTRWAHGPDLQAWLDARAQRAAAGDQVAVGATTAVVAAGLVTEVRWSPAAPGLRLQASGEGVLLSLVTGRDGDAARQELVIAPTLPPAGVAALYVPDAPASPTGTLLVLHHRGPAATTDLDHARTAATTPPLAPAAPPLWEFALQAIGEHNRRPALLAIARASELPRCLDVLLAADERSLIDATAALAELQADDRRRPQRVEAAMLASLLPRLDRDDLPPGLLAALRRHLGAGCDDTAELRRMLQQSADGAAFAKALREENLAALDDRSAAVRVRAHDWLGEHGGALDGFDPLAPTKERRAVLRRCLLQSAGIDTAATSAPAAATPSPTAPAAPNSGAPSQPAGGQPR